MIEEIAKLRVVFENCETLDILGVNIGGVYIDEITEYYHKHPGNSRIVKGKEAGKINFSVKNYYGKTEGRLIKYQDITSITLFCYEGFQETFQVNWESETGFDENRKQFYQYFGKDLNIYIGYNKEDMGND